MSSSWTSLHTYSVEFTFQLLVTLSRERSILRYLFVCVEAARVIDHYRFFFGSISSVMEEALYAQVRNPKKKLLKPSYVQGCRHRYPGADEFYGKRSKLNEDELGVLSCADELVIETQSAKVVGPDPF